jgi:hypothetical protein
MAKEVKSGLVEEKAVEKAPVVKEAPAVKEEKLAEAPVVGHSTRAFRS